MVGAVQFGLVVDQVYDTEEIVVKPVARVLGGIDVYSGNTILGDGSVCMIIDPNAVAQRLGHTDVTTEEPAVSDRTGGVQTVEKIRQRLLLVRAGGGIRKAIPLDQIARLEEIDVRQIRHSHGQMLVLYRNRLMPLIRASSEVQLRSHGTQPVLVFAKPHAANRNGAHLDRRRQNIGIVVDEILDIAESKAAIEIQYERPDILGSAIVDGEPTDIINVAHYLALDSNRPADHAQNDPTPVNGAARLAEHAKGPAQQENALHASE